MPQHPSTCFLRTHTPDCSTLYIHISHAFLNTHNSSHHIFINMELLTFHSFYTQHMAPPSPPNIHTHTSLPTNHYTQPKTHILTPLPSLFNFEYFWKRIYSVLEKSFLNFNDLLWLNFSRFLLAQ